MTLRPTRVEIDHRTIKLLVGVIAIALPILVSWLAAPDRLTSVSASYWAGDWPRSIFVGFLFAIAAFLAAYNGRSTSEMIASKIAATASILIAMFPCGCDGNDEIIPGVHYFAAATMFSVLAFFCWRFLRRALDKGHMRARARALLYVLCGLAILVSIAALGLNAALNGQFSRIYATFVYWFEASGLVAFGLSWLTASHVLPMLNEPAERFSPLRTVNPTD
jgi:hypothetical protein